jgi:hypothetical protein
MRHGAKTRIGSLSLFGALMILAGIVPSAVYAAEIIIFREVPTHNVLEPLPPGYGNTVAVPTEEAALIKSLVPGPKLLTEGDFGSVVASPPPSGGAGASGLQSDVLGHPVDGTSSGQPLSNLPGSGMGTFSSLGGLGGQISGQVGGSIHNAMQGLSGALGSGSQ